jgi:uncharacterized protein DUF1259
VHDAGIRMRTHTDLLYTHCPTNQIRKLTNRHWRVAINYSAFALSCSSCIRSQLQFELANPNSIPAAKFRHLLLVFIAIFISSYSVAQDIPPDHQDVLKTLVRKGDYEANVRKVNIRRNDLKMTVGGIPTPTPFGFSGWVSFTKDMDGTDVVMGDFGSAPKEPA